MKVITVHGIRLNNRWYEKFEDIQEVKEANIQFEFFEYGFFGFYKFLIPSQREKIIDKFCTFYSDTIKDTNYPPSVIAHSFGTYIVLMAMKRHDSIKFNSIIFCGSILNSKLDFRDFFSKGQIKFLLNDHGNREWFLKFTRYIINKYCGSAGNNGFQDIPPKYKNIFQNRKNYKRHSDYFLPLHMKTHWLPTLLKYRFETNYKTEILKPEIINRVYQNIIKSKFEFDINEISFNARIDKSGNYFAKYEVKGQNSSNNTIDSYHFVTTADGLNREENMNFITFNGSDDALPFSFEEDYTHLKKIKIYFLNSIKPNENIHVKHYFCWHETIDLRNGDTDHWSIKGIKHINIQLNFPYELKSPRLYELKDGDIIGQCNMENFHEIDNSISYSIVYNNNKNIDGLIFYFEGHKSEKLQTFRSSHYKTPITVFKPNFHEIPHLKALKGKTSKNKELFITRASLSDLKKIYKIEMDIEFSNAAREETIKDRINMFNDGFLVVKDNNDIVYGYIESLIWNEKPFETFNDISNFPMHYNIKGKSLYIIFLAVEHKSRKKGIGTKLLSEIEKITKSYSINVIRLVAKDNLVNFYSKRGFQPVKELPNFLKDRFYKSILMEKKIID